MKKTFKGKLDWYGDNGYCHGVHMAQDGQPGLIEWLDKLTKEYQGRNVEIKVEVKLLK